MVFTWFKTMVSFTPQEKLTKTALFTQWTALIAYGGGGLTLLCAPSLWSTLLGFDLNRRDEGYIRLSGIYLLALSFIYIVVARAGCSRSEHGPMLSSIIERLVYVNGALLMFIFRSMAPLYFALLFIILDSTLALLTFFLWLRETSHASIVVYFKELFSSFQKCLSLNQLAVSSLSVQIIGVLQFIIAAILMTVPTLIKYPLKLLPFEDYTEGFLSCSFLLISVLGWFHVFAGGAELTSFTLAAVFYRLSFTLPLQCILYLCHHIELNVFVFFGSLEFAVALILSFSFVLDKKKHATRIQVFNPTPEPLEDRNTDNNVIDIIEKDEFIPESKLS